MNYILTEEYAYVVSKSTISLYLFSRHFLTLRHCTGTVHNIYIVFNTQAQARFSFATYYRLQHQCGTTPQT